MLLSSCAIKNTKLSYIFSSWVAWWKSRPSIWEISFRDKILKLEKWIELLHMKIKIQRLTDNVDFPYDQKCVLKCIWALKCSTVYNEKRRIKGGKWSLKNCTSYSSWSLGKWRKALFESASKYPSLRSLSENIQESRKASLYVAYCVIHHVIHTLLQHPRA